MKKYFKKLVIFLANPRLLLCWCIAWMITNGWSYVMLGLGSWLRITWMQVVATSYLAILWFPFSPEKILTTAIAIFLLKLLFPNDQKTLAVLQHTYAKAKQAFRNWLEKHRCKT